MSPQEEELLHLTETLLKAIAQCDWALYKELCDESLTAFEPEAVGHLVQGLGFHQFYFEFLNKQAGRTLPINTISQPHVRLLGPDAGVVSYVRLQQKVKDGFRPVTVASEETRVWQRVGGRWENVHFHRSNPTTLSGNSSSSGRWLTALQGQPARALPVSPAAAAPAGAGRSEAAAGAVAAARG